MNEWEYIAESPELNRTFTIEKTKYSMMTVFEEETFEYYFFVIIVDFSHWIAAEAHITQVKPFLEDQLTQLFGKNNWDYDLEAPSIKPVAKFYKMTFSLAVYKYSGHFSVHPKYLQIFQQNPGEYIDVEQKAVGLDLHHFEHVQIPPSLLQQQMPLNNQRITNALAAMGGVIHYQLIPPDHYLLVWENRGHPAYSFHHRMYTGICYQMQTQKEILHLVQDLLRKK